MNDQANVIEVMARHQRELEALRAWVWVLESEFTDAELAVLYVRYTRGRRASAESRGEQ